jgi:acylphosphatase
MSARMVQHLRIAGRVQGVGYRAWLIGMALANGAEGWVRNRTDGTVEAVLAGPPDAIAAICEACAHGPHNAVVRGLEIEMARECDLDLRRPGERVSHLPTL